MSNDFAKRRKAAALELKRRKLDCLLVTHPPNWYYLTGFTGESAALILCEDGVTLITDGRFSGGTHGFVIGHITPEASEGGALAFVHDDDRIELDATKNTITLKISPEELAKRKAAWKKPAPKATNGLLFKYARHVKTAAEGCVTDEE